MISTNKMIQQTENNEKFPSIENHFRGRIELITTKTTTIISKFNKENEIIIIKEQPHATRQHCSPAVFVHNFFFFF